MKLLFATTNPAKVRKYKDELEKRGYNSLKINTKPLTESK